jgi:ABC-type Zn uptake system ZnuABC Zn-binding protein ZnuA
MKTHIQNRFLRAVVGLIALGGMALGAWAAEGKRLVVAVAGPDIEAIVKTVGGGQVETFSLFKGCIIRRDLQVEPAVKGRLAKADAVVWTGFFPESGAINAALKAGNPAHPDKSPSAVHWIDVSPGAVRTNVPVSNCEGYVDPLLKAGDPFFWLNPENGAVIARNVAKGLGKLQPDRRGFFTTNAEAFQKALAADISRWKEALKPMHGLRVFSTQCGWQNFSSLGGPKFVVCKRKLGELPSPQVLLDYIRQMKADVVLVDPNTPPEYAEFLREQTGFKVVEVPSSIEAIPGGASYSHLFDNLIKALQGASKH